MRLSSWLTMASLCAALLCLALSACAPTGGPAPEAAIDRPGTAPAAPTFSTADLSGARVEQGPPLEIAYSEGSVYLPGAVLPSPQGLGHLEGLAAWLLRNPAPGWQVAIAPDGERENGALLAAKRLELLQRFFRNRGLELVDWQWQVVEEGEPLRLTRLSAGS